MLNFLNVIILTLGALFLNVEAQANDVHFVYPNLSQEGFEQLAQMSKELLKQCPPPRCQLLFIGRSSSLISAYLEGNTLARPILLPLSGLNTINLEDLARAEKNFEALVLDRILKPGLRYHSNFAVVDYTNSGKSLSIASSWIDTYLKKTSPEKKLTVMAYGKALPKGIESRDLKWIAMNSSATRNGDLAYQIHHSLAESYAPYSSWNPLSTEPPLMNHIASKSYPYPVPGKYNVPTRYASYQQLTEWMADRKKVLPTSYQLNCDLKHAIGGMFNN